MNEEEEKKLPPNAVIIDVRPTDFIAGAETGIGAQPILVPSGQYDLFLPDEEVQYDYRFDTFGCVSFSALNEIEIILNLKIQAGMISPANVKWLRDNGYIDYRTGKVNFSDRFTAKMSGTTFQGNSLGAVGDSIRNHGVVPERDWAWPGMIEGMPNSEKWNLYYAEIPQHIKNKGLEFKKRFEASYQWIILNSPSLAQDILNSPSLAQDIIRQYLPYGPIQIAAKVCPPWNSNEANPPILACGCNTQHATTIYGYNEGVSYKDFDHYRSFKKLLAWDYCIPYAVQYYLNEKTVVAPVIKPIPPSINLAVGAPYSSAVRQLQECLQYFGHMKPGVFGPFGPQTKAALAAFQIKHGIPNNPQGANYGPKTRAKMLSLL